MRSHAFVGVSVMRGAGRAAGTFATIGCLLNGEALCREPLDGGALGATGVVTGDASVLAVSTLRRRAALLLVLDRSASLHE